MDHCLQKGNILSIKQALIDGDYQKAADIMRKTRHASIKVGAELRASFVEEGKMQFNNIHLVKPGETLNSIAKVHGMSLDEILKINPKLHNPDKLSVGKKLILKAKMRLMKHQKIIRMRKLRNYL